MLYNVCEEEKRLVWIYFICNIYIYIISRFKVQGSRFFIICHIHNHMYTCVTVHTRGREQEHADEDINSNDNI